MNRFILLACAIHCSSAATTIVDDYLLRLDTIGYSDKPASEKDPKETILHSVEVVARPQAAFHGKVSIGTQTLTLTGKLCPAEKGTFTLHIRYSHSNDTGITVPTEGGKRKPVLTESSIHTTAAIVPDNPVTIAGSETRTQQPGKPKRRSKRRYVALLSKYRLPND